MLMNTHEARLDALRKHLAAEGLDGFVVPISDEHMSEYVGAYARRLEWLTGFAGSAGTAVILREEAAMFVDGRYTLQVREQVDPRFYSYHQVPGESVPGWLGTQAPQGARIGFDPWLHTRGWAETVARALAARGGELVAVVANPVDVVGGSPRAVACARRSPWNRIRRCRCCDQARASGRLAQGKEP
jgi:Xaa-Pro aminopeptidase